MVVDDLMPGAVEAIAEEALRDRHPDRVREALTEWSRRHLDPRGLAALGVSGAARAPLAELFEVGEFEVVAAEMQQRVLQHAGVARAEDETVAIGPLGVGRVRAQEVLEEHVRERRQRHRGAGMPGVRLLHGVHREAADRVDREPPDRGVVGSRRAGGGAAQFRCPAHQARSYREDRRWSLESQIVSEQLCDVGRGVTLCYEAFGDASDPTALLIMGLATQMIAWQEDFCNELAGRGFHVVRFDNRDIGRSTHMAARPPTTAQLLTRSKRAATYTLADMADDAAGLLRALELQPAHVIGASMGGMIAQSLAARHPQLVSSLVSIMSTTGSIRAGNPGLRMYPTLLRRAPRDRDGFIAHTERVFKTIGSPDIPRDLGDLRALAAASYDRDHDPAGPGRQLAAIIASGDRTAELGQITAPTVVIHGSADRLVTPSGGRATARAIAGAELITIDGMGHDLPRVLWPRLIDAIADNAVWADSVASGASARRPGATQPSAHAS